jgi:sarcosine oxidase subunit alpha
MDTRLKEHPILDEWGGENLSFWFEGKHLIGHAGDSIAAALIANGIDSFGQTEKGTPRGIFCAIGKCSACMVEVDGVPNVRACLTPLQEGMRVSSQAGKGKPIW